MDCITCFKTLEPAMPGAEGQPYEGLAFNSHGHYGSTLFDPTPGADYLELYVCDACVERLGNFGLVKYVVRVVKPASHVCEYLDLDLTNPAIVERMG